MLIYLTNHIVHFNAQGNNIFNITQTQLFIRLILINHLVTKNQIVHLINKDLTRVDEFISPTNQNVDFGTREFYS